MTNGIPRTLSSRCTQTPSILQLTIPINAKTLLVEEETPTIEDAKYDSTYNWLAGSSPIVLVHGQDSGGLLLPYANHGPPLY